MNNRGKARGQLKKWGSGLLAILLMTGLLQSQSPVYGAGQADGDIRVALFVNAGSTYKSTVPAVTLQSEQTVSAGMASAEGYTEWISLPAAKQVRFSVDGFKIKALQTTDWNTAAAAVKKLQSTIDKPIVFAQQLTAGTEYQVYTGPYVSLAEARVAVGRVEKTMGSINIKSTSNVTGQQYLSTGSYSSIAEAETIRKQIADEGIDAVVVMIGVDQYAVWVGGVSLANELAPIETQLLAVKPELQLNAVDPNLAALIVREDVTLNLTNPDVVPHYMVTGDKTKLWVQGNDHGTIKVTERSARSYRGSFELSKVNGQLAVANQLPLEQYLYSVVGGEVPSSWHQEALKAQAVAARSYAVYHNAGNKFQIAPVVDTTLSQVYSGIATEYASIVNAVDSTTGQVMKHNGKVIEGIFSSNSGGKTADSTEVWGNQNSIYSAVNSETDSAGAAGLKKWYYVLLSNGKSGYVREDNVKLTGESTTAGLPYMTVTANSTNVRSLPLIQSNEKPVVQMNPGDQAVVLDVVDQSNTFNWVRGPFTSEQLVNALKGKTNTAFTGTISSLEVTKRGPSGRALEVKANGKVLDVKYPDGYRSALNGLPSTLFDIVPTGSYTVLSASGTTASGTAASGTPVLSASGQQTWGGGNMVVLNGDQEARVVTQDKQFIFTGTGNGHGLGLSQWGAKGMADAGYNYKQILQHYYQNVTIE